jgi:hypothetical protein
MAIPPVFRAPDALRVPRRGTILDDRTGLRNRGRAPGREWGGARPRSPVSAAQTLESAECAPRPGRAQNENGTISAGSSTLNRNDCVMNSRTVLASCDT